jgi:hypothetical protein
VTLTGDDAALFQIVGNNLAFRTAPNFEVATDANRDGVYNVTLNVTDNNGGTGTQAVVVTVTDVADNIGAVSDSNAAANTVAENSVVGTVVGVTALAVEPQTGDTVRYALTTNLNNLFAIDAVTGVVTVAGALNFETATSHSITVQATSSDGSTSNSDFTIAVTDVVENFVLTTGIDDLAGSIGIDTISGVIVNTVLWSVWNRFLSSVEMMLPEEYSKVMNNYKVSKRIQNALSGTVSDIRAVNDPVPNDEQLFGITPEGFEFLLMCNPVLQRESKQTIKSLVGKLIISTNFEAPASSKTQTGEKDFAALFNRG